MTVQPFDVVIDVSDNNGVIDWPAVRSAGVRIAFVKAMEGAGEHYPSWGPQSEGAHKAGIAVIPYLFMRPAAPALVVQHFLATTALGKGMAYMLDWEGRANQTCTAPEAEAVGDGIAAVAARVPTGYWGIRGSTPATPTSKMLGWERFVPRYPSPEATSWSEVPTYVRTNPKKYWIPDGKSGALPRFAQYTAQGKVAGISTLVDRSVVFAESVEAAVAWCKE